MDQVSNGSFTSEKQRAIERMREMNSRSKYKQATQSENTIKREKSTKHSNAPGASFLSGLGIPFLSNISTDSDISLILGLALILMSEKSDKLIILALLYILL